jgi:hypothetical protein
VLTEDQAKLAADSLLLRADETRTGHELWFCPAAELEDVAHQLFVRGYLNRRREQNGDITYRATAAAARAQSLHAMTVINTTSN